MPKIDHEFWESARFNNQTFMYYYKRLAILQKGTPTLRLEISSRSIARF